MATMDNIKTLINKYNENTKVLDEQLEKCIYDFDLTDWEILNYGGKAVDHVGSFLTLEDVESWLNSEVDRKIRLQTSPFQIKTVTDLLDEYNTNNAHKLRHKDIELAYCYQQWFIQEVNDNVDYIKAFTTLEEVQKWLVSNI